jgi:hypothetical protein
MTNFIDLGATLGATYNGYYVDMGFTGFYSRFCIAKKGWTLGVRLFPVTSPIKRSKKGTQLSLNAVRAKVGKSPVLIDTEWDSSQFAWLIKRETVNVAKPVPFSGAFVAYRETVGTSNGHRARFFESGYENWLFQLKNRSEQNLLPSGDGWYIGAVDENIFVRCCITGETRKLAKKLVITVDDVMFDGAA